MLLDRLREVRSTMRATPLQVLPHEAVDLRVKLELMNPFGSTKDRSALWILQGAVARGELDEGCTIVESSSGNFALAMAAMCRQLGLAFVPVLDPNCPAATFAFLRHGCDRVDVVDRRDPSGGFLATRLQHVAEVRQELGRTFWPNQYANVDAVEGHYRLTGEELVEQAGGLDFVFVGAGTGGTIAGVSQRVKEANPRVRVVAVDAEGSAIFGRRPQTRHIPGLGSSIRAPLFDQALIDDVVIVSEWDAVAACHRLLSRYGLYVGGSTGSVFHAIEQYFPRPARHRPRVAFLAADRGTAYASTVFDPSWVARTLSPPVPHAALTA